MRRAARIALTITVVLGAALVLPRPASLLVAPDAIAQVVPTPTTTTITDLLSPSPSPTESPDDSGDSDGGEKKKPRPGGGGVSTKKAQERVKDEAEKVRKKARKKKKKKPVLFLPSGPTGQFNTEKLVAVAAHLRSLGMPTEEVIQRVFPPFIVAGHAGWTNTWGAPRYGPGPLVRQHQGQDVFCDLGAPVLAAEDGVVDFGEGGLGGKVARLHLPDGSYLYYAHLSDWNTTEFTPGDAVDRGDVIGYCGNTGNAITTPPHVHFGWYLANGKARNPMRALIDWLREAEARALGIVEKETGRRLRQIEPITLERRFGDAFAPDRSVLSISGDSLSAGGSHPGSGTFTLAETALRAALSSSLFESQVLTETEVPAEFAFQSTQSPSAVLARFSDHHDASPHETGD